LKISDLSSAEIRSLLGNGELLIHIQPFVVRIKTDIPSLVQDIASMYVHFDVVPPHRFADFHVEVSRERGLRRWFSPLARFYFDGRPSFIPLPVHQAFAMLEWGVNWCVAAHAHQYLILHAAVIERGGRAVILPAPPGSGKSTLCAALITCGWRLLSDELGMYDIQSSRIYGMARPLNLKNRSIEIIRDFAPQATMTAPVPDTTKGTVCLMRPPDDSVRRKSEPANPAWIVLPRYVPNASAALAHHSSAKTFMLLAEQSFNYEVHGAQGFNAIGDLVDQCECYQFTYSRIEDAIAVFDELSLGESS